MSVVVPEDVGEDACEEEGVVVAVELGVKVTVKGCEFVGEEVGNFFIKEALEDSIAF